MLCLAFLVEVGLRVRLQIFGATRTGVCVSGVTHWAAVRGESGALGNE